MTTSAVPKITKQYRLLWRMDGTACYATVTDEGSELLLIHADGAMSRSIIGGVCLDCVFGTCTWPDCPRRNGLVETVPEPVPVLDTADAPAVIEPESELVLERKAPAPVAEPAAVTVSGDPQYEPWKAPRDTPLSRTLSWGPGNL
jgi:hypothetical protein